MALLLLLLTTACTWLSVAWAGGHFYEGLGRGREEWVNHGGDLANSRWAKCETQISTSTIGDLTAKWNFTTASDVSATPSIADGVLYFPDWSGAVYAVKQDTGALIWQRNLTALASASLQSGNTTLLSRSTPTIDGDRLIIGLYGPGAVIAVRRSTGDLLWTTILDRNPFAIITMSGTAYNGYFYVGTSSTEEAVAVVCCTFQGAVFKLKSRTGAVIWKVPMLPDNGGRADLYSGNAVWGSSPPIDVKRRQVFIATGNNYRAPAEVEKCEDEYRNLTNPPIPDPCVIKENHIESVLSINIDTGNITWAKRLGGYDTWILTCSFNLGPGFANCPNIAGPDYDFGIAPMLLTIPANSSSTKQRQYQGMTFERDIIVVGQKSGVIWALDRETGEIVWDTPAGPGGLSGGSMWGMTTDGERVFTNIVNSNNQNFTLLPGSTVINASGWVGLNATTGEILWSTANPSGGWNTSPLSHANGVVFVGAVTDPSAAFALDAKTGLILKTIPTNGPAKGPSIMDGCAYTPLGATSSEVIGSTLFGLPLTRGNSVVAFCVPSTL
ncbi:hypothetical protein Mapa_004114 [Marchantia paleacea]|nr:hypothetical protein Mapa_004114 [Marchantia paleacea]